jgi:hypothetical protein
VGCCLVMNVGFSGIETTADNLAAAGSGVRCDSALPQLPLMSVYCVVHSVLS